MGDLLLQLQSKLDAQDDAVPPWITVQQACERGAMSEKTLRKRLREGGVATRKIRGRVMIDRKALDEMLRADCLPV